MNQNEDERQLLAAHQQVIQAHLNKDVTAWLDGETDEYLSANRGEIMYPTNVGSVLATSLTKNHDITSLPHT